MEEEDNVVREVFHERDGFQVDHDGDGYTVSRGATECLYFVVRAVDGRRRQEDDDNIEIAVYTVSRCGGGTTDMMSGQKLMHSLDVLAAAIGASAIVLMDESRIHGCSGGVSLSRLLILATGQTYYNQFGYLAMTAAVDGHEGDTRSSVHFRPTEDRTEERAARTHNEQAIDRPFADVAPSKLLQNTAAATFFASRGLNMENATSRQLFSQLIRPSPAANLCDNGLNVWTRSVIRQLFSHTMHFRGEHMIKPFFSSSSSSRDAGTSGGDKKSQVGYDIDGNEADLGGQKYRGVMMSVSANFIDGTKKCPKTHTFDKKTNRCKKAARFSASCRAGLKRNPETGYCIKEPNGKTQRRPRAAPTRSMAELSAITDQLSAHVAELLRSSAATIQTLQSFNGDLADHDHRIARIDQQVRGMAVAPIAAAAAAAALPSMSPKTSDMQQLLSLGPLGSNPTTATSADVGSMTKSEIDRELEGLSDPGSDL